jgi:hypothetical protein
MENKNLVNESSYPPDNGLTAAEQLISSYKEFLAKSAKLFPKVDQKLLLDMIDLETTYKDWEGSVLLKIVYSSNLLVNTEKKRKYIKNIKRCLMR